MSFRIIQLEELKINITKDNNNLSLLFQGAHIKKTMDDAEEKTLWSQSGSIELRNITQISNEYNINEIISSISKLSGSTRMDVAKASLDFIPEEKCFNLKF